MACETFKTTLAGVEYTYTQLPASRSLRLKIRLVATFSGCIHMFLAGREKSDDEQLKIFVDAITTTLNKSTTDDIIALIFDCVATVQVGMDVIDVDKQFSGDLLNLYTLVYWVLRKEYESFLVVMIDLLGDTKPIKTQSGLKSISQI